MSQKPRLIVFLGGLRSGKSLSAQHRFAAELKARKLKKPVYLATLIPPKSKKDRSLSARVAAHQAARPSNWTTLLVGTELQGAARSCQRQGHDAWLLDGAGAWVALHLKMSEARLLAEWTAFLEQARQVPLAILVLDEVGQGGVPGHPAARCFADLNGRVNQDACARADEVYMVQAGLLTRLK